MDKIKLTDEIKLNFLKEIEEKGFQALVKSINEKSDEETGIFEVLITTEDIDRMGEVIKLDGWDLTNYMKNPVVLWGHDHYKMPIGICSGIERTPTGLLARGKFAPGEEGQQIRALYDLGIVRATSVGFIEKERNGNIITKAELIEFSFVSVPANPMALSTLVKSNISVNEMITKGFMKVETKDDEEEIKEEEEEKKEEEEIVEEKPEEKKEEEEKENDEEVKFVKIDRTKLKSIRLALKEADDALESLDESEEDEEDLERIENDGADEEEGEETQDEKDLKAFKKEKSLENGRRLAQIAATALSDALAEMRKAVK